MIYDKNTDSKMQISIKRRYYINSVQHGYFDINDYIEFLETTLEKKDAQFNALQESIKEIPNSE